MIRRRLFVIMGTALLLSGCSGWWGGGSKPPLPGIRVSVLPEGSQIKTDPAVADAMVVLPKPAPNSLWPQQGGFPDHDMGHPALGDNPQPVWQESIGDGSDSRRQILAGPVFAEGRLFAMDASGVVSAINPADGKTIWSFDTTPKDSSGGHLGGGVAFGNGHLFAGTAFGQVIALDPKTGKEIWRHDVGAPMRTAPTVADGRVFAITVDNETHTLAASDGHEIWVHAGMTEPASILGGASPAVSGGTVVVPYSSGELYALRVENGQVEWSDSLAGLNRGGAVAALSDIRARPVIDQGTVFAISHGGQMVAINMRTGARKWERDFGGLQQPWVAGEFVFVLTEDAQLVALTRDGGKVRWVTQLPRWTDPKDKTGPIVWSGPVLTGDRLIVGSDQDRAVAVSPYTGKILGDMALPGPVTLPPIVVDRNLYFLTDNADLLDLR